MNIGTAHHIGLRIAPFIILCLASTGCTASAPSVTSDRLAAASLICRDTMGLNPANAPHEQCVDSLLRNSADAQIANPMVSGASPVGGAQAACAQLGLRPDSDAFASCAANLDATIFEATHPISG